MKVGTDGVLLGAWASVEGHRLLDIGTGTGLIALMAAQRNAGATILALDIDRNAVEQAQENVAGSPFQSRIRCIRQDILSFEPEHRFDAIVCNPPFFSEDTLSADQSRALARSNQSLPFERLVAKVAMLLADGGRFSVILPRSEMSTFVGLCMSEGLQLCRRCLVSTTATKPARRVMLTFANRPTECTEQTIVLSNPDGSRTMEYAELTHDFYL